MAEVGNRVRTKSTLFLLEPQLRLVQTPQDLLHARFVFRLGRKDAEVVHIDDDRAIEQVVEQVLHVAHARSRGVAQAKRHNPKLVIAVAGHKSSLLDVFFSDRNLVEGRSHVQLGKLLGAREDVDQLVDTGDGVGIFDSNAVEPSIIDAHPQFLGILLADEQNRRRVGRLGWANVSSVEKLGKLPARFLQHSRGHAIGMCLGGSRAVHRLDVVLETRPGDHPGRFVEKVSKPFDQRRHTLAERRGRTHVAPFRSFVVRAVVPGRTRRVSARVPRDHRVGGGVDHVARSSRRLLVFR